MAAMNYRLTCLLRAALLGAALVSTHAFAQTFRMPCEVEGVIPALDDRRVKPEKVVIEIQSLQKNIFLKMNGPAPYLMQVNSLATDDYLGKNLTTSKEMGAFRKHKVTGAESSILIDQATVVVSAYNDIEYQGKKVRLLISGPGARPR
jgi:hypothetical protein